MSVPTHAASSTDDLVVTLAAGTDVTASINRLYSAQLRLRTARLRALVARARGVDPQITRETYPDESYATLLTVQKTHPRVVAALLLYPHVGAWLANGLRRLDAERPATWADLQPEYLPGLAASAVLRAGVDATVPLRARADRVFLPTLGTCVLPPAAEAAPAWILRVDASGRRITDGSTEIPLPADLSEETARWLPIRRLRAVHGTALDVALDDQDPARTCGPTRDLAPRLDPAEVADWQRAFDEAWGLLVADHPTYAEGLRAGLQSLVPLVPLGGGRSSSLTAGDAFGSVVTTPPTDGAGLALTLIHEFQHNKLSALLDSRALYRSDSDEWFYAPWRDDPRPFGAVLQGVYAHLGVADFWRVHRRSALGEDTTFAHMEFVRWRQQTEEAAAELTRSGVANDEGRRFLDLISGRLAEWAGEPVPDGADELAGDARFEHRIGWRLRNMRLEPEDAKRLAAAVRVEPVAPLGASVDVRARRDGRTGEWSARLRLMYARVTHPDLYERLRSGAQADDDAFQASEADLACLVGDYATAEGLYEAEILQDDVAEGRPVWEAWVGLVHCYPHTRPGPAADFLRARPEVVAAVHEALVADTVVLSPYETARRLALLLS
ncbi:HEXXH motif domain-containing protein [Cryptosporangium minutisporangium]|uniref:HEXXH motif domain-containing protein n=1 Tax=Cryptosporangium minutisporangium TaxID=113569 RepID=A0ABP6SWT7_9ACTN